MPMRGVYFIQLFKSLRKVFAHAEYITSKACSFTIVGHMQPSQGQRGTQNKSGEESLWWVRTLAEKKRV